MTTLFSFFRLCPLCVALLTTLPRPQFLSVSVPPCLAEGRHLCQPPRSGSYCVWRGPWWQFFFSFGSCADALRNKGGPPAPPLANPSPEALQSPSSRGNMADKLQGPHTLGFLEAAVKISHTSPDIPAEVQMSVKEHIKRHTRLQRQTTEPASSTR